MLRSVVDTARLTSSTQQARFVILESTNPMTKVEQKGLDVFATALAQRLEAKYVTKYGETLRAATDGDATELMRLDENMLVKTYNIGAAPAKGIVEQLRESRESTCFASASRLCSPSTFVLRAE
jgi:predicted P-loop ATPase/GTPase